MWGRKVKWDTLYIVVSAFPRDLTRNLKHFPWQDKKSLKRSIYKIIFYYLLIFSINLKNTFMTSFNPQILKFIPRSENQNETLKIRISNSLRLPQYESQKA